MPGRRGSNLEPLIGTGRNSPSLRLLGQPTFVFGRALMAGGVAHIIHNLSWKMSGAMTHFEVYMVDLKSLSSYFHDRGYREAFVEKCVRGSCSVDSASSPKVQSYTRCWPAARRTFLFASVTFRGHSELPQGSPSLRPSVTTPVVAEALRLIGPVMACIVRCPGQQTGVGTPSCKCWTRCFL